MITIGIFLLIVFCLIAIPWLLFRVTLLSLAVDKLCGLCEYLRRITQRIKQ